MSCFGIAGLCSAPRLWWEPGCHLWDSRGHSRDLQPLLAPNIALGTCWTPELGSFELFVLSGSAPPESTALDLGEGFQIWAMELKSRVCDFSWWRVWNLRCTAGSRCAQAAPRCTAGSRCACITPMHRWIQVCFQHPGSHLDPAVPAALRWNPPRSCAHLVSSFLSNKARTWGWFLPPNSSVNSSHQARQVLRGMSRYKTFSFAKPHFGSSGGMSELMARVSVRNATLCNPFITKARKRRCWDSPYIAAVSHLFYSNLMLPEHSSRPFLNSLLQGRTAGMINLVL